MEVLHQPGPQGKAGETVAGLDEQPEVHVGVPEALEPEPPAVLLHRVGVGGQDMVHDLLAHLLHDPQVAVVADTAGQVHVHLGLGLLVVGDDGLRKAGVGDDHQVVAPGAEAGAAPAHVQDVSGHAALQLDVVPGRDHALGEDVGAGEDVGQGGLDGQGHRQPAQAQPRDEGADVDVQLVQGHQDSQGNDYPGGDAARQGDEAVVQLRLGMGGDFLGIPLGNRADALGDDPAHDEDANQPCADIDDVQGGLGKIPGQDDGKVDGHQEDGQVHRRPGGDDDPRIQAGGRLAGNPDDQGIDGLVNDEGHQRPAQHDHGGNGGKPSRVIQAKSFQVCFHEEGSYPCGPPVTRRPA